MLPFCYRALGRGRMAVFQDVADANRRGKVDECFRVYACFSWQARVYTMQKKGLLQDRSGQIRCFIHLSIVEVDHNLQSSNA